MTRIALALGGGLALAGCVAGDRVTLLEPVQSAKIAAIEAGAEDESAVAVIDPQYTELLSEDYEALSPEVTDLAVIRRAQGADNQARLRNSGPRTRRVVEQQSTYAALLQQFPLEVSERSFGFGNESSELDEATLAELITFLRGNIERYNQRYRENEDYTGEAPGLQIDIVGYTDATNFICKETPDDTTECNRLLSERRAGYVYYQLKEVVGENNLAINMSEEVSWFGAGDLAALSIYRTRCLDGLGEAADTSSCDDTEQFRVKDDDFKVVWVTFR